MQGEVRGFTTNVGSMFKFQFVLDFWPSLTEDETAQSKAKINHTTNVRVHVRVAIWLGGHCQADCWQCKECWGHVSRSFRLGCTFPFRACKHVLAFLPSPYGGTKQKTENSDVAALEGWAKYIKNTTLNLEHMHRPECRLRHTPQPLRNRS
jgi:hypothetical protein